MSLSGQVLAMLSDSQPMSRTAEQILSAIRQATGFNAVGIRLKEGDDFPYHGALGFSLSFLLAEDSLMAYARDGAVCRDADGQVKLECTCGLVLSGKTDPSNPLFTARGSAWTNDARNLLHVPSDQDPRLNPRNRCIHEGFQSVALIPIRGKDQILGLLQINDRRKDCFTPEMIRFFEDLACSFGSALVRQPQELAIRESENNLRTLVDALPESALLLDTVGTILVANVAAAARLGLKPRECIGRSLESFLPALQPPEDGDDWITELVRTRKPAIVEVIPGDPRSRHKAHPVVGPDGSVKRIVMFATELTQPDQAGEKRPRRTAK